MWNEKKNFLKSFGNFKRVVKSPTIGSNMACRQTSGCLYKKGGCRGGIWGIQS